MTERGPAFPVEDMQLLAKAHVEGRTLLINAIDHSFVLALGALQTPDGRYSLVSVLAHELGHAFGLDHDDAAAASIMSAAVSTMSLEPTDADAREVARVLGREIQGSPPGALTFAGCKGLRARHHAATLTY